MLTKPIKINNLCWYRSHQKILDDLNDQWPATGVVVLLGANGAGKSTLLNVLAGLSHPDSGLIDAEDHLSKFLMPEPASFYPQLTVREQLMFVSGLFENSDQLQVDDVINLWQLQTMADKLTKHLSLGYRQRLSLAQTSIADADMLLLDEPMNGMDPEVMKTFKSEIMNWKQSKSVVVATHIMHEAQELADWVVVMFQGKILYSQPYQQEISFQDLYQQTIANIHNQETA